MGSGQQDLSSSRPTRGAPRWQTSSGAARSSSSITSCSNPTTRRASVAPGDRGRVRWLRGFTEILRCHAFGGGALRAPLAQVPGVQRRTGRTFPLGVLVRQRLQLPTQRLGPPRKQRREGKVSSTTSERCCVDSLDATRVPERVAHGAAMCGTDAARYTREQAGHQRVRARGRRRSTPIPPTRAD